MNSPNKLSLFRIILVPVIAVLYLLPVEMDGIVLTFQQIEVILNPMDLIVLALFAIASFTDFLDGNIARKRNLVTSFGKFIDPIADKLLVNTMFILFAVHGVVSVVPVIIMIWRDTIVDGLRMNASKSGVVVAAGMAGKLKTVLQMFAIIFLLLQNVPFAFFHIPLTDILVWGATLASVVSGLKYFMELKGIIMETM
ncbi:CDP-diacylglycerol--glycerol-3-phosphate 3-phosphatidyltransferase [[Eubacterium] hominis]|uniref:CDP-diacylglycerol--glycerol-3-phosphate 3-phosphatidyltransferase n=1 Tax=[Eubacterium] hominis TaxID=2764325 RepID=UPI003A4D96D3